MSNIPEHTPQQQVELHDAELHHRPATHRREGEKPLSRPLWGLLLLSMAVSLAIYALIPRKSYFIFDSEPAFYAFYGLAVPFALVIFARMLGFILKRKEQYWQSPSASGTREDDA